MKKASFLLLLFSLTFIFFMCNNALEEKLNAEALTITEQSIRKAAVQCYALEGSYPADISYLEQRYGISIDSKHYFVDYIYIGSNLMPDITVLPISQ